MLCMKYSNSASEITDKTVGKNFFLFYILFIEAEEDIFAKYILISFLCAFNLFVYNFMYDLLINTDTVRYLLYF